MLLIGKEMVFTQKTGGKIGKGSKLQGIRQGAYDKQYCTVLSNIS